MPVYRSAQGRQIDMTQLAAKNEKVRAVGNMNVNARGDVIDSDNKIIKDNTKRVKNTYNKTVSGTPPKPEKHVQRITHPQAEELSKAEQELFDDNDEDIEK
jgi:hypothetical protein